MRAGGRLYWRRIRERERSASRVRVEYRSDLDYDEYRSDLDYERIDIMEKIDSLPMGWRLLINEHGFTPVMQARQYSSDINVVEKLMKQRWRSRQQQLADRSF